MIGCIRLSHQCLAFKWANKSWTTVHNGSVLVRVWHRGNPWRQYRHLRLESFSWRDVFFLEGVNWDSAELFIYSISIKSLYSSAYDLVKGLFLCAYDMVKTARANNPYISISFLFIQMESSHLECPLNFATPLWTGIMISDLDLSTEKTRCYLMWQMFYWHTLSPLVPN